MGRTSRPTKTGMSGDVRGEACFALLNRNIGCSAVSHSAAGLVVQSRREVGWIENETIRLFGPDATDEFIGCQAV